MRSLLPQSEAPASWRTWLRNLPIVLGLSIWAGLLLAVLDARVSLLGQLAFSILIGLCAWGGTIGLRLLVRRRISPLVAALIASLPASLVGLSVAGYIEGHQRLDWWLQDPVGQWRSIASTLLYTVAAVVVAMRVRAANEYRAGLEAQHRQMAEARQGEALARLALLQAHIEPHFLFDTLASVQSLIEREPRTAARMLDHLNRYLRSALARTRGRSSTCGQEMELIGALLAIAAIRLGARLRYTLELPEALRSAPLPPLLLQPLVENALKHGIEPAVEGGEIAVACSACDGRLVLKVRDNGVSVPEPVTAGLASIRARLDSLYGGAGQLTLHRNEPRGTVAEISLPLTQAGIVGGEPAIPTGPLSERLTALWLQRSPPGGAPGRSQPDRQGSGPTDGVRVPRLTLQPDGGHRSYASAWRELLPGLSLVAAISSAIAVLVAVVSPEMRLVPTLLTSNAIGLCAWLIQVQIRYLSGGRVSIPGAAVLASGPALLAGLSLVALQSGGTPWWWLQEPARYWRPLASTALFFGAAVVFGLRSYAASTYRARLQAQLRQVAEARQGEALARLALLQAQIEPHFLFNTLANVQSMIEREPQTAARMLEHLNRYLRAALGRTREPSSTCAQEMELIEALLAIAAIRLGARLRYTLELPGELRAAQLPPLLLQPLVENALKHGIEPAVEGGEIEVKGSAAEGRLVLRVSDTGLGFKDSAPPGVGLSNVRARLESLYGQGGQLTLHRKQPRGTVAEITLPLT